LSASGRSNGAHPNRRALCCGSAIVARLARARKGGTDGGRQGV